jgi:uncharacterized membrane protein SpoIIM required for sporulation
MKEITFINQNLDRWKKLEQSIKTKQRTDAEALARNYIELNDDLAYARTYYPGSDTEQYLNNLTFAIHQGIYKNKKVESSRFKTFWKRELPLVYYQHRKTILWAFLVFWLSVVLGWVSQIFDNSFARIIVGDGYVNMTLENIKNNDPMAVYKSMNGTAMFLGITINNIYVAFLAFVFGIFTAAGSGYMLFRNGVMLGAFQGFFVQFGLLSTTARVIWIHGTIEISSIIVAGAAGMVMGNSFLFPGTYPRLKSFQKGVKDGLKMAVGLIPMFTIAGFFEGYVTRHTEMPVALSLIIISLSLVLVLWYFIFNPIRVYKLTTVNNSK